MSHAETQTSEAKDAIAGESKPRSRGDKRRARILLAFHDCILDKGYARTTLRDVSRKADISASHLLYYFSGKDAILEQYFENVEGVGVLSTADADGKVNTAVYARPLFLDSEDVRGRGKNEGPVWC